MPIIVRSEPLPLLSTCLKNLWNWVSGVSFSFQFLRKSSEILWVWMVVICTTQPVHCVKLNCLLFSDSMEAWWLCRLVFLKGGRLHRVFVTQDSNFTPKTSYFRGTVELNNCMCGLGWHAWQYVPGFPSTLSLHHYTSTPPSYSLSAADNNVMGKHQRMTNLCYKH